MKSAASSVEVWALDRSANVVIETSRPSPASSTSYPMNPSWSAKTSAMPTSTLCMRSSTDPAVIRYSRMTVYMPWLLSVPGARPRAQPTLHPARHDVMRSDAGDVELVGVRFEAGARIEAERRRARVAPHARGALRAGVLDERVEDRGADPAATVLGSGRHPAHAPLAGLAVRADEPDGNELVAVERGDGMHAGRLVRRELLQRLVRPQH